MKTINRIVRIFGLTILVVFLAGCSIAKKPVSSQQTTETFKSISKSMINIHQYNKAIDNMDKKKNKKVIEKYKKQIAVYASNIKKLNDKLQKEKALSDYPKAVQDFGTSAQEYAIGVGKRSAKQQELDYHKAVLLGIKVGQLNAKDDKLRTYVNSMIGTDSKLSVNSDQVKTNKSKNSEKSNRNKKNVDKKKTTKTTKTTKKTQVEKKNKTTKKAKTEEEKNREKSSKKAVNKNVNTELSDNFSKRKQMKVSIGYVWGTVVVLLSGMIITSVFLQPNKSDDRMNALQESGGATLFTRPKPKGYSLFLIRTTEILTILLVIVLLYLNRG